MPYNITDTKMRVINPQDEKGLAALAEAERMTWEQYLQQTTPRSMVKFFEPEFTQRDYLNWAHDRMEIDHPGSNFRYAVVDHTFTPVDSGGKTLRFPFMLIGLFDYKGKTYAGSFVAGHGGGMLGVKGEGHPEEAINLQEPYRSLFTAEVQQRLSLQSMQGLLRLPGIAGAVVAIPNWEGRNGNLLRSGAFHLLTGGHVTDQYKFYNDAPSASGRGSNPLKGFPVSFRDPSISQDAKGRHVYYPFVGEELLKDPEFCRLCHDIRHLGVEYQRRHPTRKEGVRFDRAEGRAFVERLVGLGQKRGLQR